MPQYKLNEDHSFHQKVDKLYDFMQENGIMLDIFHDGMVVIDTDSGEHYKLRCYDTGERIQNFPTGFEYKLTITKE
jgi:hypothetical protein